MNNTSIDVDLTSAGYHVELGASVTEFTLTDVTFTGTPGTNKIHVLRTTGTVTISASGSNVILSEITSEGATINLVGPQVTLAINCKDATTQSNIENVRVYLKAASGGPLPADTEIINQLTDASGNVSTTFDYTLDQPITGVARKASASPFYKSSLISGTITSSGFSVTVLMIKDE